MQGQYHLPPNTHTTGPNSWGLHCSTSVLLAGLYQRQVSNQGQGPHFPRGCSKLADQKLGQQSGQVATKTMRASWVEYLQPPSGNLFHAMLGSQKRGPQVGQGKHDCEVAALVPVYSFYPPLLVFPTHYSFLFFSLSLPFSPLLSVDFLLSCMASMQLP